MDKSSIIRIPNDDVLIARLRLKLEEYKKRYDCYRAPELQLDTLFKIRILGALLNDHKINTRELARKWIKRYSLEHFDVTVFDNACDVIRGYIETGGINTSGGTGLPELH